MEDKGYSNMQQNYGYDQGGYRGPAQPGGYDQGGYGGPPQPGVMMQQPVSTSHTTVVVQQQAPHTSFAPRMWSTPLFGCMEDVPSCLCVTFCGLCAACQLSQDMGEHMCVPCCMYDWLIILRTKHRTQQNITGTVMDDCCTATWCGACAMCQLMREVKMTKATAVPVIRT